jgi:hypothetical protein
MSTSQSTTHTKIPNTNYIQKRSMNILITSRHLFVHFVLPFSIKRPRRSPLLLICQPFGFFISLDKSIGSGCFFTDLDPSVNLFFCRSWLPLRPLSEGSLIIVNKVKSRKQIGKNFCSFLFMLNSGTSSHSRFYSAP